MVWGVLIIVLTACEDWRVQEKDEGEKKNRMSEGKERR